MRISDWSSDVCSSDLPSRRQHGFGVTGHLHLAPDSGTPAIAIDQKGRTLDSHVFAAIHALFHPDAVGVDRFSFGIAAQPPLQRVFAGTFLVAYIGRGSGRDRVCQYV